MLLGATYNGSNKKVLVCSCQSFKLEGKLGDRMIVTKEEAKYKDVPVSYRGNHSFTFYWSDFCPIYSLEEFSNISLNIYIKNTF